MQSKAPIPPAKAYYQLIDNVWQRCFATEAEMVVCVTAPMTPVFNEFMYAIDFRSHTKITDLNEIAPEICADINLRKEEEQSIMIGYVGNFSL